MKCSLFLVLYIALFFVFLTNQTHAQTSMSNDSYNVEYPSLNSFSGTVTNPSYKLKTIGGNTTPGQFTGTNYTINTGSSSSTTQPVPFTFSISSSFIDFGPITPGAPVTRTNTLTISSGSTNGYSVLVSQNHPLRSSTSGVSIPDTTCDTGTCNESIPAAWTSLTTFGFGYRCDNLSGTNCDTEFTDTDNFKQFASSESAELAQPILTGINSHQNIQAQVSYKVNISSSQPPGQYQNSITFIAIPSL